MKTLILLALLSSLCHAQLQTDGSTASFRGSLPPKPILELNPDQIKSLEVRLARLTRDFSDVNRHPRAADADIFLKAVRYAIEFHEWYGKNPDDDPKKAIALLDEADERIRSLRKNETPWMDGSGQKILGFYSKIDDSPQPYGVEVPEGLLFGRGQMSVPMWIWLHGRGDTDTDLHFVFNRLNSNKLGQFQPKGTIVIHPFGRYCNGWKSAGETDVFEARDDAIARFNIDLNRIVLAGFSMGGAGAWHIGAHFADQWACVHTGAGFVDVKRYQKVTSEKLPPWYEQKLWGVYDVPNYARNFLNVPLICYSGEIDPQRDSAEYMSEVLDQEGLHPPHLIGPGMGHKYHPEVIKDVQSRIEEAVATGRDSLPRKVILQTRSLAYSRAHWLQITGMREQWEDARAEANWDPITNEIQVTTKNVTALTIRLSGLPRLPTVQVDGVLTWNDQVVKIGGQEGPSTNSVPVLCYPNPLNPSRYVIVNSGLTFREVHDRTNSLQNPKLPDWAILDISELASVESAGKVLAADFFDSRWKVQARVRPPSDRE